MSWNSSFPKKLVEFIQFYVFGQVSISHSSLEQSGQFPQSCLGEPGWLCMISAIIQTGGVNFMQNIQI
jgi:hypothetical protein